MDRVFQISELLGFIFNDLDTQTKFACALVCTSWSDVALDKLWRVLDSPKPLLALLSPLEPNGEEVRYLRFRNPVLLENWAIFDRYARRVRVLTLNFVVENLSSSVFVEMGQKRPSLTLLPSLTSFQLVPDSPDDLVHALLFMSLSVKQLRLCHARPRFEVRKSDISEFFDQCSIRMPKLKWFELASIDSDWSNPWSISEMELPLSKYLASLTDLELFGCPFFCLVPSIAVALSQLPLINRVSFDHPSEVGYGLRDDVLSFRPSLAPGSFAALVDLTFSATFTDASNLMNMDVAPALTALWIHTPVLETAEALNTFIVSLSERRPKVKKLYIDAIASPVHEPLRDEHGNEVDVVTPQTLLPLLQFPNMKWFKIAYHRPVQLRDDDIGTLLSRWTSVRHFHFASDPLIKEEPTLTIDVLPIIARCCPKLHTLSLYLDTKITTRSLSSHASSSLERPSFICLESISFGLSMIEETDVQDLAFYLSDILPRSYTVGDPICGASWVHDKHFESQGFGMDDEVVRQWNLVSWAVDVLLRARVQERRRVRRREKDLKMRVAVLEEQLRMRHFASDEVRKVCAHQ